MIKNAIAVVAGGTLAFVWSSISWMVIPWHQPTMNVFDDEDSVGAAIKAAAVEPGIYTYPGWTDDHEAMTAKHEEGPYVFASIVPDGVGSEMGSMMLNGWLVSVLGAAFLLVFMLFLAPGANWKQRSIVAVLAALFVSLIPALLNWNWWHYPAGFTVVTIVDGFISWTVAGVVVALIVSSGKRAAT